MIDLLGHLLLAVAVAATQDQRPNLLVVSVDDMGVDRIGAYGEHPDPGRTPNVDRLARQGVLFRNAWATPVCSSSRAAALTGRYGFRTGVGSVIHVSDVTDPGLPLGEVTVAEALRGRYVSHAIGKWHMASTAQGPMHPLEQGFATHRGTLHNLANYFHWPKNVDGVVQFTDVYATTDTAEEAIAAVRRSPEPWFLWVAFNAPHKPWHAPPAHLHSYTLSGAPADSAAEHYKAMLEAADTELGRLLAEIDLADTTVVFWGDNGTPAPAVTPPFVHAKGSAYEGGVNVPLIVAGHGVAEPGRETDAFVHVVDLFPTLLEFGGVAPPAGVVLDGISLVPHLVDATQEGERSFLFTERFEPNGNPDSSLFDRALRGERYKLIHSSPLARFQLYDLELDPHEEHDLLLGPLTHEQRAAFGLLWRQLVRVRGS